MSMDWEAEWTKLESLWDPEVDDDDQLEYLELESVLEPMWKAEFSERWMAFNTAMGQSYNIDEVPEWADDCWIWMQGDPSDAAVQHAAEVELYVAQAKIESGAKALGIPSPWKKALEVVMSFATEDDSGSVS